MSARIAVIYYSATGNVHRLAQAIAEGAEHAGGEVRLAMSRSSRPSS
jgi:NAD(P)H dehydrogenase (quinone)